MRTTTRLSIFLHSSKRRLGARKKFAAPASVAGSAILKVGKSGNRYHGCAFARGIVKLRAMFEKAPGESLDAQENVSTE